MPKDEPGHLEVQVDRRKDCLLTSEKPESTDELMNLLQYN